MTKDSIITLSIDEAGTPPRSTFLYHVMVNGNVFASNLSLSPIVATFLSPTCAPGPDKV